MKALKNKALMGMRVLRSPYFEPHPYPYSFAGSYCGW